MPLTKRQFKLGVDEEAENWMRLVYKLLANNKELAYSENELGEQVLNEISVFDLLGTAEQTKFRNVLDVLVSIEAVEKRDVAGTNYYAYNTAYGEFDTTSWEPTV